MVSLGGGGGGQSRYNLINKRISSELKCNVILQWADDGDGNTMPSKVNKYIRALGGKKVRRRKNDKERKIEISKGSV